MERNNLNRNLTYALFYGSIWGITEATLGYILHTIPVLISGSIMFPIAILLMQIAYKKTKSKSIFILMGLTAALIKLVDIFIPGLPVIKTINPMIAILLEATAVSVFSYLLNSNKIKSILLGSLVVCFFWRILFVFSSYIINQSTTAAIGWVNSLEKVFSFIMLNGIISASITFCMILIVSKTQISTDNKIVIRPSYAMVLFISASFIQFII